MKDKIKDLIHQCNQHILEETIARNSEKLSFWKGKKNGLEAALEIETKQYSVGKKKEDTCSCPHPENHQCEKYVHGLCASKKPKQENNQPNSGDLISSLTAHDIGTTAEPEQEEDCKTCLELIDERDLRDDIIDKVKEIFGIETEWSNIYTHGAFIDELMEIAEPKHLTADMDDLLAVKLSEVAFNAGDPKRKDVEDSTHRGIILRGLLERHGFYLVEKDQ